LLFLHVLQTATFQKKDNINKTLAEYDLQDVINKIHLCICIVILILNTSILYLKFIF